MAGRRGFQWSSLSALDTGLSLAEKGWQIFTLVFVGGGGIFTGLLAKADPLLRELGPIYWVAIGLLTSVVLALVLLLIRLAALNSQKASYYASLVAPKSSVNPLADLFVDSVIHVDDLRLPGRQLHKSKTFKRCKFVGPATLAFGGGTVDKVSFHECGDAIVVPTDTEITGMIYLLGCTIVDCEFYRVTLVVDSHTGKKMQSKGMSVAGL